jgi:chromate reductase
MLYQLSYSRMTCESIRRVVFYRRPPRLSRVVVQKTMKVVAISGSLRRASSNLSLVRAAARYAPEGMEVVAYQGLGDLPHFNPDLDVSPAPPAVAALRSLLKSADAVLISSPEYAHGVPGALKNALDWLVSSGELGNKPVALMNTSVGGEHAQAALAATLAVMEAKVVIDASLAGVFLKNKIDEQGNITNPELIGTVRARLRALRSP